MAAEQQQEQPIKKQKMSDFTIGTHNGTFHADEALAIYLLRLLPEYAEAKIVRSRDPATLEPCNIVVDVGGVYDHSKGRYDHHQRGFVETLNSLDSDQKSKIKLSSAGLVYFHYGKKIVQAVTKTEDEAVVNVLFNKMYYGFIQEIDAIDNGVSICEGEPNYHFNSNVSSRVGQLVPGWNDPVSDFDGQFAKAMELIGSEFVAALNRYNTVWLPARSLVETALKTRTDVDASGEILVFPTSCPWKSHFYAMEAELVGNENIKYVLYPDTAGSWRIQCVSLNANSFGNRKSLPEPWCGVRDAELSEKSGIADCIFVHAAGFIGGNKTKEGAMAMAKFALTA